MNIEELEKLIKLLERKPTVFIGAGVSKAISGSEYADWAGWLQKGLQIIERRIPAPEADEIKSLLEKNDSDSLIKAAAILKQKTVALNIYTEWMRDTIGSLKCVDKRLIYSIKDLMNLGCRVVTTNFDCLIEEALGFNSLLLSNKEEIVKFINGATNSAIVHFHGIYSRTKGEYEIVATDSEYLNITNDEGKQFFQKLLLAGPVLFIGCGNTQNDPNIGKILEFLTQMGFNDFYFLCKNATKNEGDFQTIIYGQKYEDLPGSLDDAITSFFDFGQCFERVEKKVDHSKNNLNDFINIYSYDSRYAPFKGRDKEFERLQQFMDHKNSTWWAVTGKASTGKSRLALEFALSPQMSSTVCLYLTEIKEAIPKIDQFLKKWPVVKLLIVIDYILGREEALGEFIVNLSKKYNTGRLKLLLLEREPAYRDYGWFYNLSRNKLPDFSRKLMNYFYQEQREAGGNRNSEIRTLELAPLEDRYLEQIADELKKNTRVSAKIIIDQLKKVDPGLCRPLYLQLLIDNVVTDDMIQQDGLQILQNLFLKKYEERIKERCYKSCKDPERLFNNTIALITYSCALNGINLAELDASSVLTAIWKQIKDSIGSQFKGVIDKDEAVKGYLTFINDSFQRNNRTLPALQPDIIAEFFVLNFVGDDQRIADFSEECWRFKPDAYSVFLIRLCQDFGKTKGELALKYLAPPNEILDIDRLRYWIFVSLSAAIYFENQYSEKLIKQVENKLEEFKETEDYSIKLQVAYAMGLVNMIHAYGAVQELGKAGELLEKLAVLQDESSEIKLRYSKWIFNIDYGTLQELEKAGRLFEKLFVIPNEIDEIKLRYAQGLVNMINAYGRAQEFGKAGELLKKLAAIQDDSGEIKLRYANGLFNMIYYYGRAQEFGKAGELLEKLAAIQDESGEIKLRYAMGLFSMIYHYGRAQELGKAGELSKKLAAIQEESGEIKPRYAKGLLIMIDAYERLGILDKLDKKEDLLRMLDLICEDLEKLLGA